MPGSEFLARAKPFGSRRHQHPGQLEIGSQGSTQNGSVQTQVSYEQQRIGSSASSAIQAVTVHQASPQSTYRSPSIKRPCGQSNDSTSQSHHYGSLEREKIGLAIGSPRESTLPALPSAEMHDSRKGCQSPESVSTVQSESITTTDRPGNERLKGARWKNLGGLFGKRVLNTASPSVPFYQVEPSVQGDMQQQRPFEQQQHTPHTRSRQTAETRRYLSPGLHSSHKTEQVPRNPSTVESRKVEVVAPRRKLSLRKMLGEKQMEPSPKTLPRLGTAPREEGGMKSPTPSPMDNHNRNEPATLKLNGGSLLEVDIPSVQLERFSIMFENLLQPQTQATLSTRAKGQLEELRPTDGADPKSKPCTETWVLPSPGGPRSTSPAKSPILSLFPSASPSECRSPGWKQPLERSPLHRSATALGLSSPYRTRIEQGHELPGNKEQDQALLVVHSPSEDLMALEKSRCPKLAYDTSKHSQTSTETSFHCASETQPMQATPAVAVRWQEFPEQTSSGKRYRRLKNSKNSTQGTRAPAPSTLICDSAIGQAYNLKSKSLPDLQPSILNPPTLRIAPKRPDKPKYANQWRDPSPTVSKAEENLYHAVTGMTQKETKFIQKHTLESRSRSAPDVAAPIEKKSGYNAEAAFPPQRGTVPTIATTGQPDHKTHRPPSSPPHTLKPRLNPLQLPPLPYLGSQSPENIRTGAELSIARQISVSHAQRELLVPMVPRVARQPMLVDVHDGSQVARKSQHLVLENA